jgi:hypothetical protein
LGRGDDQFTTPSPQNPKTGKKARESHTTHRKFTLNRKLHTPLSSTNPRETVKGQPEFKEKMHYKKDASQSITF